MRFLLALTFCALASLASAAHPFQQWSNPLFRMQEAAHRLLSHHRSFHSQAVEAHQTFSGMDHFGSLTRMQEALASGRHMQLESVTTDCQTALNDLATLSKDAACDKVFNLFLGNKRSIISEVGNICTDACYTQTSNQMATVLSKCSGQLSDSAFNTPSFIQAQMALSAMCLKDDTTGNYCLPFFFTGFVGISTNCGSSISLNKNQLDAMCSPCAGKVLAALAPIAAVDGSLGSSTMVSVPSSSNPNRNVFGDSKLKVGDWMNQLKLFCMKGAGNDYCWPKVQNQFFMGGGSPSNTPACASAISSASYLASHASYSSQVTSNTAANANSARRLLSTGENVDSTQFQPLASAATATTTSKSSSSSSGASQFDLDFYCSSCGQSFIQFGSKMLGNSTLFTSTYLNLICLQDNAGNYCYNKFTTFKIIASAVGDYCGSTDCGDVCKTSIQAAMDSVGCCLSSYANVVNSAPAGAFGSMSVDKVNLDDFRKQTCGIAVPNACSNSKAAGVTLGVPNLKYSYYLANKDKVSAAVKSDVAETAGVLSDNVVITKVTQGATTTSDKTAAIARFHTQAIKTQAVDASQGTTFSVTVNTFTDAAASSLVTSLQSTSASSYTLLSLNALPSDSRVDSTQGVSAASATAATTTPANPNSAMASSRVSILTLAAAFIVAAVGRYAL